MLPARGRNYRIRRREGRAVDDPYFALRERNFNAVRRK